MQGKINLDRLIRTPTQIGERFKVKGFSCSLISVVFIIMYEERDEIGFFFLSFFPFCSDVDQFSQRQKNRLKTLTADKNISVLYSSACSHLSELVNSANLVSGGLQALINCYRLTNHICSSDRRLFQLPYCARLLTCSLSLHYQHFRIH